MSDVDGAYGRTTINLSVCDENTDDGDFLTANSKNLPNWYYIRAELICDAKAENGGAFTAEDYAMKNNINYYVSFMNKGYCKTGANKDYSFYKSYTESEVTDQIKQLTSRQDIYKNFCSGIIAGKKDTESARDFEFFGWKSVVLQGFELYGLGITSENSQELADQDSFWHSFTKGATWLYTQIMNLLGLDTMEEIFLNKGRIGNRTYMGLFPKAWLPVLNFVNIILQLIVWSLLAFSITRLLFKRSLATMNVGEKINLMEGMKDIIISAIVMGIWPLLFTMMGRFNYFIVDMFGSISPYSETFTLSLVSGANMFLLFGAYFILAMTVYFNYFYILRSLTLAFLYALAPIFIYTISLGGKGKSYFGAYIKEVTGHIYIQSIHALMISFFSYLDHAPTGSIGLNWLITKMVLIWAFVPITKFVRSAIFQMGDGVMGQMADQIQDTMGRKRKYGKDEAKAQADRMAGSGGGSGGSGGSSGGGSPAGGGREASISEAIARRRRSESDINSRDGTKNKDVYKATKKREAEMKKVAKMKPEQIDKWARNKMDGQSEKNILQKMSDSKAIKATKKIASNAIEGTTLGQGLKAFENLKNASRNDNGGISGKRFVSNTAKGLGKAAISGAGKSLKAGVMMGGAIQKSAIGNTQAADYYARRSGFESQVGKMQASAGFHEGISGNDFTTFNQEQSILDNPKNNSKKSQLQDFADSMRPYGRTKEGYTIYDFNTDKMSEMNEFLNNPENKKDQQTYNAANNRYSFVKNLDYYKDKPDDLRKLTGGYFNENNKFVDAEGRLNNSKDYIRMNADMNVAKVFDQAKENQKNNKGGNH